MREIPIAPNKAVVFESWAETTGFEQKTTLTELLPNGDENPLDEYSTSGVTTLPSKYGDTNYTAPATGSTVRIEVEHKNGSWVTSKSKLKTVDPRRQEIQTVDLKEEEEDPPPPTPWDDSIVKIDMT